MNTKTYIITGGSSGTGREVSKLLTQQGHDTVIWGRNEKELKGVIEADYATDYKVVDISNPEEVVEAFGNLSENKQITGVVHAAGIWSPGNLIDLDSETINKHIAVVTQGTVWVVREAIKHFSETRGIIVLIAAASAKPGFEDTALNTMSKRAIDGLQEAVAREILDSNIKLTTIYPDSIAENESETVKLGNAMSYSDVANAVLFALNSTESVQVREILLTSRNTTR